MQYLGGKSRIAKKLAPIILELAKGRTLVEPFCGAMWITEQVHPVYASDASAPLISLIQAVRNGWTPPASVSKEEYAYARTLPPTHPAYGFCGFGCSFGGILWSSYAHDRPEQRYAECARNSLIRTINKTRTTDFGCCSYDAWQGDAKTIFYCDPPYAGTAGYKGTTFCSSDFWSWCTRQAALGAIVIVSEYVCPQGVADEIAAFAHDGRLGIHGKKARQTVERLFRVR
jgi:DNA adenine methylase